MNKYNKISIGALIVIAACFMTMPAQAEEFDVKSFLDNVHVRVGVAYKTQETGMWFYGVPMRKALTARLGVWYRFNNVLSSRCYVDMGVDHHSQYSEGAPFNNRGEYAKTEAFLDGTCTLGGLL